MKSTNILWKNTPDPKPGQFLTAKSVLLVKEVYCNGNVNA